MIIGIGTDIIDIRRIEKLLKTQGKKFEKRVFTDFERGVAKEKKGKQFAAYYAKRFAAKEALAKALGTGIGASLSFQDIEIYNHVNGLPAILLNEKAKNVLIKKIGSRKKSDIHLSLSDEYPYAQAFVVISA